MGGGLTVYRQNPLVSTGINLALIQPMRFTGVKLHRSGGVGNHPSGMDSICQKCQYKYHTHVAISRQVVFPPARHTSRPLINLGQLYSGMGAKWIPDRKLIDVVNGATKKLTISVNDCMKW